MKIFIAAGHGDKDSGAVALNTTEAYETINLADQVTALLKTVVNPDQQVILVPDELDLRGEVDYINKNLSPENGDICVEIHLNSNSGVAGSGIETYFGWQPLAEAVQKKLVEVMKLPDRGVKDGTNFYFNNSTIPYSCLVEVGFINNPTDLAVIREKGALAVASGVASYLGVSMPTVSASTVPATDYQSLYKNLLMDVIKISNDLSATLVKYSP